MVATAAGGWAAEDTFDMSSLSKVTKLLAWDAVFAVAKAFTLFLDTFWIPDETLVTFASDALISRLSTELFFSAIFFSTSFLIIKAFCWMWVSFIPFELPGLSWGFLLISFLWGSITYRTDERPLIEEATFAGTDSTLASDALFFMVVSLVTDSLPCDFSCTLEEEFSLDFCLSGEENLVELV